MPNGVVQPPPPPAASEEIQTDGSGETEEAGSPVEAVLNLLEVVLSLL
ncbi:MAG TPA: hypothetical protein VEY09_15770 [Pyrinomonadaceae bacterium]|nr:hypothetical protein [Pyrinomonadaceae bacterium]